MLTLKPLPSSSLFPANNYQVPPLCKDVHISFHSGLLVTLSNAHPSSVNRSTWLWVLLFWALPTGIWREGKRERGERRKRNKRSKAAVNNPFLLIFPRVCMLRLMNIKGICCNHNLYHLLGENWLTKQRETSVIMYGGSSWNLESTERNINFPLLVIFFFFQMHENRLVLPFFHRLFSIHLGSGPSYAIIQLVAYTARPKRPAMPRSSEH